MIEQRDACPGLAEWSDVVLFRVDDMAEELEVGQHETVTCCCFL